MAYQCNNCGPGCGSSNYSTHDYEGHGADLSRFGPDSKVNQYDDINKYENSPSQDYHTVDKDEAKKEDEEKQHTIEDDIKKGEQKEEKGDEFKAIHEKLPKELLMQNKNIEIRKKKVDSIEEAINKAIKCQKEVMN